MAQERVQKQKTAAKQDEIVEEVPKTDSKEELKEDLDELLDEIDSVLEENAEAFVKGYIQKAENEAIVLKECKELQSKELCYV